MLSADDLKHFAERCRHHPATPIGLELATPWRDEIPVYGAVLVAISIPEQPCPIGAHFALRIGENRVLYHPVEDAMARHRRFREDRTLLGDLFGRLRAEEAADGVAMLNAYEQLLWRGPSILPSTVLVPPRQAFAGECLIVEPLPGQPVWRRHGGKPFEGLRVHLTMMVARDIA